MASFSFDVSSSSKARHRADERSTKNRKNVLFLNLKAGSQSASNLLQPAIVSCISVER